MASSHGRFVWYELATTDIASAKAFYTDVLGWGTQDVPASAPAYTLFTAGGAAVSGLMELSEATASGLRPSWLGYVGVNDVNAAANRIEELGGAVHVPPTEIPNVARINFSPPQGRRSGACTPSLRWSRSRSGSITSTSAISTWR
jgi:predicted enzyme related to lactoylglutathione lyase